MDFQTWPLGAPANPWRNLRVFSVSPNWSGGLLESLSWLTDVMISERAVEQRRTVRRWPRRMIECSFLRKGAYRSRLDSFMAGTGRELFLVPLWHEQFFINNPTSDGNVYFPAGTLTMREYNLGDLVMVSMVAKDPNTYAVLQVTEYDEAGDRIKLASIEDTGTWPIGSRITPLRRARILDSVTQNGLTDDVATAQIRFTLYDPDKYFTASWGPVDRFWPFKADRTTPFVFSYDRQSYTQDFDVGLVDVVDPSNRAQVTQSMMMTLFGRANVYAFRSFLYAARGKAIRFYVPTGMSDLQLTTDLGGTTFETKQNGLSEYMLLPQECRELIEISYADGRQKTYRRIVGVQAVYDDTQQVGEQITVDSALPDVDMAMVSRISYVVPSRFNSDLFEFSHKVDDSAAVQVAVSTVSSIQSGMPPLPPDPPSAEAPPWHILSSGMMTAAGGAATFIGFATAAGSAGVGGPSVQLGTILETDLKGLLYVWRQYETSTPEDHVIFCQIFNDGTQAWNRATIEHEDITYSSSNVNYISELGCWIIQFDSASTPLINPGDPFVFDVVNQSPGYTIGPWTIRSWNESTGATDQPISISDLPLIELAIPDLYEAGYSCEEIVALMENFPAFNGTLVEQGTVIDLNDIVLSFDGPVESSGFTVSVFIDNENCGFFTCYQDQPQENHMTRSSIVTFGDGPGMNRNVQMYSQVQIGGTLPKWELSLPLAVNSLDAPVFVGNILPECEI